MSFLDYIIQYFLYKKVGKEIYIMFFLHDFLRSEENINQINDAYLSNNQGMYNEFIILQCGTKSM